MEPEITRMITRLIRKSQTLRAERTALMTIIKRYAHIKKAPLSWKADLDLIRQSPDYRAIAEELDPTISALEQAADQTEVLRLIEQLGGDEKLPN
jgi:hypothetical protein